MASVSVKDEVSEVAGVKLIATGSIEGDRRTIGNLCRQMAACDRQGVGGIELVGVKRTWESAQLGRTKLERLYPVAGEIQFTGNDIAQWLRPSTPWHSHHPCLPQS